MKEFLGKPVNVIVPNVNLPPVKLIDIDKELRCAVFEAIMPEGQPIAEGEVISHFSIPLEHIVLVTNSQVQKQMAVPMGQIPPGATGLILPGNGRRG